jgi:uncharacterized membrane protein YoaK (UPF0700 family)
LVLTFVAGAANAGAFLAVHQYTPHMTGIVSSMADHLMIGAWDVVMAGVGALVAFVAGAACSAVLVNLGRRRTLHSEFAGPLLLEAALLLFFGLLGSRLAELHAYFVPLTVMLLSFTMGLQNALITKLSRAEIRTTHVTGIVTDIGIELGKMAYWNRTAAPEGVVVPPVRGNKGPPAPPEHAAVELILRRCGGGLGLRSPRLPGHTAHGDPAGGSGPAPSLGRLRRLVAKSQNKWACSLMSWRGPPAPGLPPQRPKTIPATTARP